MILIRSVSEDMTVKLIAELWSDDTPSEDYDDDDDASVEEADSNQASDRASGNSANESDGRVAHSSHPLP